MVKDPVCGMEVDPQKAAATSIYGGTDYYFCSAACKKSFDKNPDRFVAAEKPVSVHKGHGHGCCHGQRCH